MKTTLQIPVNKKLRDKAKKAAEAQGFSSLQEVIRLFLYQFADRSLTLRLSGQERALSIETEDRYIEILKNTKNKPSKSFSDIDELMNELNA